MNNLTNFNNFALNTEETTNVNGGWGCYGGRTRQRSYSYSNYYSSYSYSNSCYSDGSCYSYSSCCYGSCDTEVEAAPEVVEVAPEVIETPPPVIIRGGVMGA